LNPACCCSQDGQPTSRVKRKASDRADSRAACQPEDVMLLVLRSPDFFGSLETTRYYLPFAHDAKNVFALFVQQTPLLIASVRWSDD